MEYLSQFFFLSIRFCQQKVVADTSAHQRIALGNEDKVRPGTFAYCLFTVGIEEDHCSLVGLDESQQQTEQSCLAGSRMSHKCSLAAGGKLMCKMRENLAVAQRITEAHILNVQTQQTFHLASFVTPFFFCLHVFHLFQPVYAGRSLEHLRHHIYHLQDGLLNLSHQLQERSHHTKGDYPFLQLQTSPDKGDDVTHAEAESDQQAEQNRKPCAMVDFSPKVLLHVFQPFRYPVAAFQRSQDSIMFHRFLHQHLNDALLLTDVLCHLADFPGHHLAYHHKHRSQQQQHPCQAFVHRLHQQEGTRQLEQSNAKVGNDRCSSAAYRTDIFLKSRRNIA